MPSHKKKKKKEDCDWKRPTEVQGGFHWWKAKASEPPQCGKATGTAEACGHERCGARDGVFIPAAGCCGIHERKDAALGWDEFMEVWSHMWLPGCSSGSGGSHVPDRWRLNEIFLCFPHFCTPGQASADGHSHRRDALQVDPWADLPWLFCHYTFLCWVSVSWQGKLLRFMEVFIKT